jgi:predicted esterase
MLPWMKALNSLAVSLSGTNPDKPSPPARRQIKHVFHGHGNCDPPIGPRNTLGFGAK